MTRLVWDAPGARRFETGVDRGVLYPQGQSGVPWNGLRSVQEKTTGGGADPYFVDGFQYANAPKPETFGGTINAYTYPREFAFCDGTEEPVQGLYVYQQLRRSFGLSYRTLIGNDLEGTSHGYKLHIVYNALATPNNPTYDSQGGEVSPEDFSWNFTTTPVFVGDVFLPSAHLVIDSTRTNQSVMQIIEDRLYGTASLPPMLLTPEELIILLENAPFRLEIIPSPVSGLLMLEDTGIADLVGFPHEGLYDIPAESRLVPTATPGLYTLGS